MNQLGILFLLLAGLLAQSLGGSEPAAQHRTDAAPSPLEDQPTAQPTTYLIGPQDILRITVFDEPDLSGQSYRVDSDGLITFWLLGRVKAAGLTPRQFQDKLRDQLASGYLKNPQVRVDIEQYKSQSVYVFGEVRQPGRISMTGTKTLLEALADAGSPTSQASAEVTIVHSRRATGTPPAEGATPGGERTVIDLKDLQAAQLYVLRDGDIVTVPRAQTFFIGGEVRNNGSFIWQRGMTLAQAVTLAGGLTDRGTYRGAVTTRLMNGKPSEIRLEELDAILPDDTVKIKRRLF
jgi:polysaccharide export outer membrane protein